MNIRIYQTDDIAAVLEVFRLNTPNFFDSSEQEELEVYLADHGNTYYVMEENGRIVGCGGYHFDESRTQGRISWDFFHPDYKGRGLGRKLVSHCLEELRKEQGISLIIVWTSQLAYEFYSKFGFKTVEVVKDHWAPGLDLYRMEMQA